MATITNRFSPEYWAGNNLLDDELFERAEPPGFAYLDTKEYLAATRQLSYALGQVAAGNATEVRFSVGHEFNTDLPVGSLVVVDQESVAHWEYQDPDRQWQRPIGAGLPTIPPQRPYSQFWRRYQQDNGRAVQGLGVDGETDVEGKSHYVRFLKWGVIAELDGRPVIQPFGLNQVRLRRGRAHTPRKLRRSSELQSSVIPMPVAIGQVDVWPRLWLDTCSIDTLERVRSVDVVYPATAERQRSRARRLMGGLPRLSPRPGMAPA